ncbi:hypothetical protein BIV57_00365 [Mangrovactinospora gilvigrisea]|uniref:Nudix hydrolase domain-containing protein n=1 Tax=Mangrovactinospora gilvigrisea TaxID=1428644 RepID=A0A1J7CCR9_9ACTN|nr:hypothetical protein BIV57_00365 [Mangrovactinospora gilvigrisea]
MLIQRRWKPESDPDNLGKWELPGGKWRAQETAAECLRRELLEECGIGAEAIEGRFVQRVHGSETVETSSPTLLVQMVAGGYPSLLVVYTGYSEEQPAAVGDGARDAVFMDTVEVKRLLEEEPETFTALTFAALGELLERGLL